ncbi:hypothetical protein ACIOMM_32625 [Streptomyces sp. NPDC087908]|uniref:hypothetical protein n=1 Tax=Streptomyces sp. NPDC087908 TaxID=3365820 RepID=UPI00381BDC2D
MTRSPDLRDWSSPEPGSRLPESACGGRIWELLETTAMRGMGSRPVWTSCT